MLRDKNTTIISEIRNFFTSEEKAFNAIVTLLDCLTPILSNIFKPMDKINTQHHGVEKMLMLLLFPFFKVNHTINYQKHISPKLFDGGKDLFYRLLKNENILWRRLLYKTAICLIGKVQRSSTRVQTERCLIVDDTDLKKTGRCIELIGKIFSHVTYSSFLGFKGLFLGYHDGSSFFGLDYSLHGEKGSNKKRPYGLSKKDLKNRYSKKREKDSCGYCRKEEYFKSKIQQLISMIRNAIKEGVRFDYLLVDSWFTCFEIIKFIKTRRIACHFLGMIKMGKTKYKYKGKEVTSKQLAKSLNRNKKVKYCKKLKCWHSEAIVDFKGYEVKLFFCRSSKRRNWCGLLTTNTALNFEEAYRIYSKRWTIEVFFKECKQCLGLGKCQSKDFDAQIASITICLMQYNMLSVVKRFEGYETLGELFRESQADTLELTVFERIWQIIIELLGEIAEVLDIELEVLMEKIFSENEGLVKLQKLKRLALAG